MVHDRLAKMGWKGKCMASSSNTSNISEHETWSTSVSFSFGHIIFLPSWNALVGVCFKFGEKSVIKSFDYVASKVLQYNIDNKVFYRVSKLIIISRWLRIISWNIVITRSSISREGLLRPQCWPFMSLGIVYVILAFCEIHHSQLIHEGENVRAKGSGSNGRTSQTRTSLKRIIETSTVAVK